MNLGPPSSIIDKGNSVYDYASIVERMISKKTPSYIRFPGVTPGWDNTSRRQKDAYILNGSTPKLYEKWLRNVIESHVPRRRDEKIVFINAWNEWAEGAHLEPCRKWGLAYLEATKRALDSSSAHFSQSDHRFARISDNKVATTGVSVCIPI